MFIKLSGRLNMDVFERCVEAFGDPQLCSSMRQVGSLVRGLANCVEAFDVEICYRICLEGCRGEGCAEACLGALEVALGVLAARAVAMRAAAAVTLLGIDPVDAVTLAFDAEVKKVKKMDCPARGAAAKALAAAAVELYKAFKKVPNLQERAQDALLLMAPALAVAHKCVGDRAFEYLEFIRPFVEEEAIKRIVAAMEEGAVLVGGVAIKFEPVKAEQ
jgi:hypothetical protein